MDLKTLLTAQQAPQGEAPDLRGMFSAPEHSQRMAMYDEKMAEANKKTLPVLVNLVGMQQAEKILADERDEFARTGKISKPLNARLPPKLRNTFSDIMMQTFVGQQDTGGK